MVAKKASPQHFSPSPRPQGAGEGRGEVRDLLAKRIRNRKAQMRLLRTFIKTPFREKLHFFEAAILLFSAKLLLTLFPFKFCIKTIRKTNDRDDIPDQNKLINIRTALQRANRLAFWKNVCLVQSFAGKWMLQRRGIKSELYIGVNFDEKKKFMAHAWLKSGGLEITHDGGDYHQLHVF
jgi:hypothetical protein